MHLQLSTPGEEANFNFASLIIGFQRHNKENLSALQQAIAWEPGQEIDERGSVYRSLLKHEATHFLDMTTTHWGWQYTFRKLRLVRGLLDGVPDVYDARRVFALDTGELAVHTSLIKVGNEPPATCDTIRHHLIHTDEFGVCIIVEYIKNEKVCHQVPASMLSLLEANATASEFLSQIQCAESHQEFVDRLLSKRAMESRFEALLNDPDRMEYSCFVHLTRVHFSHLPLENLLKLISAVARFSLDAAFDTLGYVTNIIQRTFVNQRLGATICMELRRDHCRHLVFFKTVLLMYSWREDGWGATKKEEIDDLVRDQPIEAVHRMWSEARGNPIRDIGSDRTGQALVASLAEWGTALADSQLIRESVDANRQILRANSAGLLSFKEMKLLNPILADGTELNFPNCFDIRTYDYFNQRSDIFTKLDIEDKTMAHHRFHLHPDAPFIVQLDDPLIFPHG